MLAEWLTLWGWSLKTRWVFLIALGLRSETKENHRGPIFFKACDQQARRNRCIWLRASMISEAVCGIWGINKSC